MFRLSLFAEMQLLPHCVVPFTDTEQCDSPVWPTAPLYHKTGHGRIPRSASGAIILSSDAAKKTSFNKQTDVRVNFSFCLKH